MNFDYFVPYINKYSTKIILDTYQIRKARDFCQQMMIEKEKEEHFKTDKQRIFKRTFSGILGELAIEKILNISFVDWSIGKSKEYNYADLKNIGLDIGIKTSSFGSFPIISKSPMYPEIITFRNGFQIYVVGVAKVDILKEYTNDYLIKDKKLSNRKTKTAFIGIDKTQSFYDIESLKKSATIPF